MGKLPYPFLFLIYVMNTYTYNFFHFIDHVGMTNALLTGDMAKNKKHNIKDKKMKKLLADIVKVIEGGLYNVMGEDEMLYVYDCLVEAIVGDDIYHNHHVFYGHGQDDEGINRPCFNAKNDAEDLVSRIYDAGSYIDPTHWTFVGKVSEQEDPLVRLEREWSDCSDHYEDTPDSGNYTGPYVLR